MSPPHPLAETLRQHLSRFRGSWQTKLTPELKKALEELPETDLRRAATMLLHGPATCPEGKIRSVNRIAEGWQFCGNGRICPCFMQHFHETSESTNMAKRGVKNAAQAEDVKKKTRDTCMERYGIDNTGALPQRIMKAEATNLERYGAANVFASPEIQGRIRTTVTEKYGVEHISLSPEHQKCMREGVQEIWGVDNVAKHPDIQTKIKETNFAKYGGVAPACAPEVQLKMRLTMDERLGGYPGHLHIAPEQRIKNEEDFRRRFTGRRANEIAEETGYHPSMIHRYAQRWGVALDYTGGDHRVAENTFAERLTAEGLQFERNVRLLKPADVKDRRLLQHIDFYFPQLRFGVEFCGAYWHSQARGRSSTYHAHKLATANRQNIDLIQIFEDEWIDHPVAVIASIKHRLGLTQERLYARKCILSNITHGEANAFYDTYHVFGGVGATVHLGLRYANVLVACMSFTTRSRDVWELVRFATRGLVVGAASRLLRTFERDYEWRSIKSFYDLRWSRGALYERLGFQIDKYLAPDYAYVIGDHRIHKFNLRKSSKRFKKYAGMNLTERQMADLEDIPRVYDAGKVRVIKFKP